MMHKQYQDVFNRVEVSQSLEESLLQIPENCVKPRRMLRRPSKVLIAVSVTLVILLGGVFTADAATDGVITEWIAGIAYQNNSAEYREEFSRYDVYQVKNDTDNAETVESGKFKWKQKDGEWYGYINGNPAEGFYLIDGYWYYFTGGYMWHDCKIPPGDFDSEGRWIYEGKKNSDYDVSPAPVFLQHTLEEYCQKEISSIRIRKYTPADPEEYFQDKQSGNTENYYVEGFDYGDDFINVSVDDILKVSTVETEDDTQIAEICDNLLKMKKRDYLMELLPEQYRIVFLYSDGTRDYINVREKDGDCCISTRAGERYYGDIQVIEDFYNALS